MDRPDRFLFFDLETDRISDDWEGCLPHITLAGTRAVDLLFDRSYTLMWYGLDDLGGPAPRMSAADLAGLAKYLWDYTELGYWVVTWNGAAFDFQLMYEHLKGRPGARQDVVETAILHWDIMYQFVMTEGHYLGLQAAATGLGVKGKTGVGSDAPDLWNEGRYAEAMKYQEGDVRALERVALEMFEKDPFGIPWISSTGIAHYSVFGEPYAVNEAAYLLEMPRPHWVSSPPDPDKMVGWLYDHIAGNGENNGR